MPNVISAGEIMKRNISCNIITNDDGSSSLYGLELCCIYSQEDDAQYHTVTRCVNGITDSFEEVCELRRILLENEVEPMHLADIVSDLL